MGKTDNAAVFEQESFWDGYYDANFYYAQKIRLIETFIPHDVKTILDVGCGKGDLLRKLQNKYDVCGCDRSVAALSHVTCRKDKCGTDLLPYSNSEFDLVTCCQVLEHLPDDIFAATIRELNRVSRKYLLITVPNNEVLDQHVTKCATCNKVYHVSGHVRRFRDLSSISNCFPEYKYVAGWFCGYEMRFESAIKRHIQHRLLSQWHKDETAICSYCQSKEVIMQKVTNIYIDKILRKFKVLPIIDRLFPPTVRPWWMGVLMEKRIIDSE